MRSAVTLLSGGMDSTVLAYEVFRTLPKGTDPHFLSFNYGQRHKKELEFAKRTARKLGAEHTVVDLSTVQQLIGGSALTTSEIAVPDGHYTAETMRITVVPNRNMIMLAIAVGYAVSRDLETVGLAVHAGDHAIYPDCRPEFIEAMVKAVLLGNEGFHPPRLWAPFLQSTKTDICFLGHGLGVPWADTWSCYKGGAVHCGTCGTCVERREAFALAHLEDPTEYVVGVIPWWSR